MVFPAKTPGFVKLLFPHYVWDFFSERKDSSEKVLYLTFDDGPVPEATEFVLQELAKYDAKATFFCIGANVEKNSHIFNEVISRGHAIGNHTQDHPEGWKTDTSEYIENTLMAEEKIKANHTPKLFRPPYGRIKRAQGKRLRALGYKIIMWDVVAKDWLQTISEEECLTNIKDNATNRSIIVMHDSMKAFKNVRYILPKVLAHFSKEGYKFEKIT
jgi:peptidoglycan/xylan/chitin deacetylase (PgdA/CDA1 family)